MCVFIFSFLNNFKLIYNCHLKCIDYVTKVVTLNYRMSCAYRMHYRYMFTHRYNINIPTYSFAIFFVALSRCVGYSEFCDQKVVNKHSKW